MELETKKGFKQTEVGLIPEDWLKTKVNDVFDFSGGSQPPKSTFVYRNKKGYIRLLQIRDYKSDKNATYIPERLAQKKCMVTDIMIGRYGPPIFQILRGIEGAYNVALLKAIPKGIDKDYAYHFLKQDVLFEFIEKLSQRSSGQTGVDLNQLKEYQFPLPPTLAEQKAIATALSDVDDLISSLDALIAKKKAIKQGAMQQLLTGKIRLTKFDTKAKFVETGFGLIPNDWEVKLLPEVINYIHGKAHEQFIDKEGQFKVVNSKYVSSEGRVIKYSKENFCPAKKGDILTVLSDLPNGKALAKTYFVEENNVHAVNQRVCIWRSKGADALFLNYIMNRNKYFLKFDDGVTQTHILNHHIEKCPIILPKNIEEQKAIGICLRDMDKELEELATKKEKYEHIKQGMMQELLTGKTRLV